MGCLLTPHPANGRIRRHTQAILALKGDSMRYPLLFVTSLAIALSVPAFAQPRKCMAADGKVTYSDVACPDSTTSERTVETRGNTLDGSELREQAQKNRAAAEQAETTAREQAAVQASSRQQAQAQAEQAAKRDAENSAKDEAAYLNCTRDVERQGVTEDVKAELYAACRTAGGSQRRSSTGEGTIRECVRNVERTGTAPADRARQVATCHGADVKPEPPVLILRPAVSGASRPLRITGCTGNQCSDDAGQRYFKQQGNGLVREDGKACQLAAGNTVRCP